MRVPVVVGLLSFLAVTPAAAQEAKAPPPLLAANSGLMLWTLFIFILVLLVLTKFAFKPITKAVEARERALEEAIEAAKHDREEAARLLDEHRRMVEAGRAEAQKFIVEGRAAGEKMRADLVEHAHREQQQMLERARQEIGAERDRAIAELRREAVDLAVRGASKVIERNLDDSTNRALVETFLASIAPVGAGDGRGRRGDA